MNILKVLTERRKIGNTGERAAVRYLRRHGYKILKRNYVFENAEIDIIARKNNVTAFIEVKCRTAGALSEKESRPAASVTHKKQRKIIAAAHGYLSENTCKTRRRLDVIEVLCERVGKRLKVKEIKHLEGAFTRDTALLGR